MSGPRRQGPARRRATGPRAPAAADPSRAAALDVLDAVRDQGAYTNLALAPALRSRHLAGRDAAFTTELVAGTVRLRGSYDAVLAAVLDRPLERLDPPVLDALRLGCHQLLSMRVPTHAAVSTTVDLVRARVGRGPAGLANAVLRKVAAHDLPGWLRRVAPDPGADPVGFASVVRSHPRWVVELLTEALGAARPGEDVDALLAADNEPPRVTLAARPGACGVDELVAAGGVRCRWSPYGAELPGGDPGAVPAVADGRAGVQDEGSQLVALALAGADLGGPDGTDRTDGTWLDLCAGPGGKAALLAGLARERGARLLAAERQEHRARLVARACAGVAGGLLAVVAADGTRPPWRDGAADRVLVDAPCTGLGALRRRPEARWRRRPEDVQGLVELQRALLRTALAATRPGGLVAYVTCSPVLAETAGVVSSVLAERDDVRLVPAAGLLTTVPESAGPLRGTVQLWPHVHGTDAMFLALLSPGH